MEKINFVNNSEPYLSAENLNQIQNNVEIEINEIKNNNLLNTNKINEINDKFVFSKDEKIIGKWINGKNIYRKVIESNVASMGQTNISVADLNYEIIWVNQGKSFNQYDGATTSSGINWYNGSSDYGLAYINTSNNLVLKNNSSSARKYYVTIEYTKVSD